MPRWKPEELWPNQDVYIIGGGPSLSTFDWNLLRGRCTIGCNSAYKLGADVCRICFFGDQSFWNEHHRFLPEYKGLIVTNNHRVKKDPPSWLYVMDRPGKGAHRDYPGWNGNSGACAVNLALILGAKRVLMLGFDMKSQANQVNWYRAPGEKKPAPYARFMDSFAFFAKECAYVFPDREIINVNDDSDLNVFPKVSLTEFIQEELV